MANLNNHRQTLLLLSKAKPRAARKIINSAPSPLIKTISEICLNILNGVIKIPSSKKKILSKHKSSLRQMASPANLSVKRKILVQRGGFIATVLSLALPFLIKGVSKLVSVIKKKRSKRSKATSHR